MDKKVKKKSTFSIGDAKVHLGADEVVGCELEMKRCGYATGFVKQDIPIENRVHTLFEGDDVPNVGLGRLETASSFMSICKVSAGSNLLSLFRNSFFLRKLLSIL